MHIIRLLTIPPVPLPGRQLPAQSVEVSDRGVMPMALLEGTLRMATLPEFLPLLLEVASPRMQLFLPPKAMAASVVEVLMNPVALFLGLEIRDYAAAMLFLVGRLLLPIALMSPVLDEASEDMQVLIRGARPLEALLVPTLAPQVLTLPILMVTLVRGAKAMWTAAALIGANRTWPQPVFVQPGACIRLVTGVYALLLPRHLNPQPVGLVQLETARSDESRQKHKWTLLTPRPLLPNPTPSALAPPLEFPAF